MRFKMNGITYTIKEVSQHEYKEYRDSENSLLKIEEKDINQGVYFGATHAYQNVVFIDENLPLDRKKKTLIHELTHCYISEYITHVEATFTEEDVADIAANSHDIIHRIVEEYFRNDKN